MCPQQRFTKAHPDYKQAQEYFFHSSAVPHGDHSTHSTLQNISEQYCTYKTSKIASVVHEDG